MSSEYPEDDRCYLGRILWSKMGLKSDVKSIDYEEARIQIVTQWVTICPLYNLKVIQQSKKYGGRIRYTYALH